MKNEKPKELKIITDVNQISTETSEGQYLLAAIALITSKDPSSEKNNELLVVLEEMKKQMFKKRK